jgi:hypothetical protein
VADIKGAIGMKLVLLLLFLSVPVFAVDDTECAALFSIMVETKIKMKMTVHHLESATMLYYQRRTTAEAVTIAKSTIRQKLSENTFDINTITEQCIVKTFSI